MEELKFKIIIAICIFTFGAIAWLATIVIRKKIKLRKEEIALQQELKKQKIINRPLVFNKNVIIATTVIAIGAVLLYLLYKKRKR
jgi:hypothetical protein